MRQNYEKYLVFSTKTGQYTLFFNKKLIFFDFLFVYSQDYPIFAFRNRLKLFIIHFKKNKIMNKTELIDQIAAGAGLTKVDAKKALDATVATIKKALVKGDKVQLVGFGTFAVTKKPAREGINPATKQKIKIAAKKVAKFKAGAELADAVNK